jgi:hypothetical protein
VATRALPGGGAQKMKSKRTTSTLRLVDAPFGEHHTWGDPLNAGAPHSARPLTCSSWRSCASWPLLGAPRLSSKCSRPPPPSLFSHPCGDFFRVEDVVFSILVSQPLRTRNRARERRRAPLPFPKLRGCAGARKPCVETPSSPLFRPQMGKWGEFFFFWREAVQRGESFTGFFDQ